MPTNTNTKSKVLGNEATQEVLKNYFPEDTFVEVTRTEASALRKGTFLVVNGIVYVLNEPSRRMIKTKGHLCERCAIDNFLRCANVMGPESNHIENHSHILEGIENRSEKSEKAQLIVFDCKCFKEGKQRPRKPYDPELLESAKYLLRKLKESKNTDNNVVRVTKK